MKNNKIINKDFIILASLVLVTIGSLVATLVFPSELFFNCLLGICILLLVSKFKKMNINL